jgi:hypothetical protein
MPHQTGLADALRGYGVTVVEHSGWKTRGNSSFNPRGVVAHHTGPWSTISGIVNLCIRGRSDLPGPLANVCLAPDGTAHVIAAGRANHAGTGGWRGLTGNSSVFGIEAIHSGAAATPWPPEQLSAYFKVCAAMAKYKGFGADLVCGHKEWRPGDKIDPVKLDMNAFRAEVAKVLSPPPPPPKEAVVAVNRPPVAIIPHPNGYWVITDDGGVFTFGSIPFHGSLGSTPLNAPIVDAAATKDFGGYWMVGADGGVFGFGNAQFYGSAGNLQLSAPISAIAVAPDGLGYWLMAKEGGLFSFGSARFFGRVEYQG